MPRLSLLRRRDIIKTISLLANMLVSSRITKHSCRDNNYSLSHVVWNGIASRFARRKIRNHIGHIRRRHSHDRNRPWMTAANQIPQTLATPSCSKRRRPPSLNSKGDGVDTSGVPDVLLSVASPNDDSLLIDRRAIDTVPDRILSTEDSLFLFRLARLSSTRPMTGGS